MSSDKLGSLVRRISQDFDDSVVDSLERYTTIPCISPAFDPNWHEHGELRRAAELLADWCGSCGIDGAAVEVLELDNRTPLVFAEIDSTDSSRHSTTLIYGHFDKQPALGPWRDGLAPFRLVQEGDRLYGRGTADDGYATYAAFSAIVALRALGASHGRIVVLIEGSEESGSPDLDAYVSHLSDRLGDVGLIICLDSECGTYDRLWLTTSLRGLIAGELRVQVMKEGVHSGKAGGIVPSSFRICRELLSRIEDELTGEITLAELNVEIPHHRQAEIAEIADEFGEEISGTFPTEGRLELAGTTSKERIENGTWRPCLEVIGASGLPALEHAGNVLRPLTSLQLSIRIPPTCDTDRAAAAIERVLRDNPPSGAAVEFRAAQRASGWDAPMLEQWLSRAVADASLELFGAPMRSIGVGGSIPFMAALGARYPTAQFLATGVLGPHSNAHGPNEFLHLPTAKAVSAAVAHVLSVAP